VTVSGKTCIAHSSMHIEKKSKLTSEIMHTTGKYSQEWMGPRKEALNHKNTYDASY